MRRTGKREKAPEKAGKVKVAPGVTVGSLRHFRDMLIEPNLGLKSGVGYADRVASATPIGKQPCQP